jgi:hypothetical protein
MLSARSRRPLDRLSTGVVLVTASVEVEVTYNNWLMMYVARIRGSACGGGACYANKQRWKPKLVLTFQK